MRDIEFRAWHKSEKYMEDVFYIDAMFGMPHQEVSVNWHLEMIPIQDLIIMQYTGLKDKNGVKIFEGDILHILILIYSICIVEWNSDKAAFCISYPFTKSKISDHLYGGHLCEVIGNIHENPELIEAAE